MSKLWNSLSPNTRIRCVSAGVFPLFLLIAALLLFASDWQALLNAYPTTPGKIIKIMEPTLSLFLGGVGMVIAATPLIIPLFSPRFFLQRPLSRAAKTLTITVLLGGAITIGGLLAGGVLQNGYFSASGYHLCDSQAVGPSLRLNQQIWVARTTSCDTVGTLSPNRAVK